MGLLLLTATLPEQAAIVSRLESSVCQRVTGRRVLNGSIEERDVTVVETGMGAVNTAHALTRALQVRRPAYVLQVGVGGAYADAGLGLGDLAVASEELYGDVGVRTKDGWRGAELIGIPLVQRQEAYYNRFPVDGDLAQRGQEILAAVAWKAGRAPTVKVGPFVTVQECSGTTSLAEERAALAGGAVCENMEGAAAAHVCLLYDVPFVEIRGISNLVEDRRVDGWDLPGAAAVAQEAAIHLLKGLDDG